MLSNKTYDILVWIAQVVLPALSALIVSLADIWGIENGVTISATIMAVDAFMGALLKVSSINYSKKSVGDEENGL